MDFEIKWDDRAFESVPQDAKRETQRNIERELESVRCPDHGTAPKLRFREAGTDWIWEIDNTCCVKLERAVAEATYRLR
jgi:hypothetical protein